jgi:putative tryptophan/tyrosine transport system substrate-binding protein
MTTKTIGFLVATTHHAWSQFTDAFEKQLSTHGWQIGTNIKIEYQSASGLKDLYQSIAKDFANSKRTPPIDIIVTGGTGAVLACKKETSKIPIVFATAGDPVNSGLVTSKPTGNLTGISNEQTGHVPDRLQFIKDNMAKDLVNIHVGAIGNVNYSNVKLEMKAVKDQAPKFGFKYSPGPLKTLRDIRPTIKRLKKKGVNVLFVCTDPLLTTNADILNEWALLEGVATMHAFRENCGQNGLMFWGPVFPEMFKRAADLVDMILKGTSPATIPVETPKKFEHHCNKKVAQILGLKSLAATL